VTAHDQPLKLFLFIVAEAPRSITAIDNINRALHDGSERAFDLEIVDVAHDPERALLNRVLITPTLLAPASARRLVGDLSEAAQLHYFLQTLPPTG
jgi:circadian clock protein KaiB